MTNDHTVELRGGGIAHQAIYDALVQAGRKEPDDFVMTAGPVAFTVRRTGRSVAIATPSNRDAGLREMLAAAAQSQGIHIEIVEEAEAVRNPGRVVSRLLREVN